MQTPGQLRVLGPVAIAAIAAAAAAVGLGGRSRAGAELVGPDLIAHHLFDGRTYDPVGGDHIAYAFGVRACNIGDAPVSWRDDDGDNRHPVIAQNLYRLHGDRLVQIGMAWLKHGYCAVDGDLCGTCEANQDCDFLGVGCSDPYGGVLNGFQEGLGPRWQVNGFTGGFPFPPADPAITSEVDRRVRVLRSDVDPARFPGAAYFAEAQYVAGDEAASGNGLNSASYRAVLLDPSGAIDDFTGATRLERFALSAWPGALVAAADVPGEGRFSVASKAIDLGGGMWRYEYAVRNVNSDRAAGGFAVAVPAGARVTGAGFHDVEYHSGEPFDGTDWTNETAGGVTRWSTTPWSVDPDANALRWGTQYNYWFECAAPPVNGTVTIELFKPFAVTSVAAVARVPAIPPCPADCGMVDGVVGVDDLVALLGNWGSFPVACDLTGDGAVDAADLVLLLEAFGPCG